MLLSLDRTDADDATSISFDVITAVAEKEGVDPVELEPPKYEALYDVVNPEALDSLFSSRQDGSSRASGRVEFTFCGYDVVVTSDGEVELEEEESFVRK